MKHVRCRTVKRIRYRNDIDHLLMPNSYFILTSANNVSPENNKLGDGATCIVEQSWDDGRRVFVKHLKPEYRGQKVYETAFRKEYEIGSRLDSPFLPRYIRMDEDGSIYEEFVDGMTLDRVLVEDPDYFREERHLRRFLSELLQGLEYLHSRQILHLDLKPQNVMLTRLGHNVKIVDLGFAYSDSFVSSVGATREFAAPEFLDGSMLPDTFMDIYSVGCLLRYIADTLGFCLPMLLQEIQDRCLMQDPAERYQTVDEILPLLDRVGQQSSGSSLPVSEGEDVRRSSYRKMVMMAVIGCLAVAVVCGVWFMNRVPQSFPLSEILMCRTLSSDSLTVEITHDTTEVYRMEDGEMDVTIPQTVTGNGYTFTVTQIDSCTFRNCKPLIAIVLPQTLRSIGNRAFENCDSLSHINIPDSVTHIGEAAFIGCKILRSVRLPQNLDVLDKYMFSACFKLKEVEVPRMVRELRRDAFGDCRSLENVILPEGLQVIDRGVFWNCFSLKAITIPSTVTRFGDFVFWNCRSLKDVYMLNPEPPHITDIFHNLTLRIHVPAASVGKYRSQQYWRDQEIVAITP